MKYVCEGCNRQYDKIEEAIACENSDDTPVFSVGDIVVTSQVYGWFDGDPLWIAEDNPAPEGRSISGRYYTFVYVIVGIKVVEHEVRYNLRTKACGQAQGWTSRNHYKLRSWTAPPEVVEESKRLIEEISTWRLL